MNNLIQSDEKVLVNSSLYIVRCGYLWGLVSNESFIMKPIYDYIWIDSNDKIWAMFNGKTFLVELNNFPNEYDYIEPLEDGNHLVYKNDLVGVCDANMNEIITPTFFKVIKHNDIFWCCVDKELDLYNLYTKSGESITHEPINYNPNNFPIINSLTGWNIIGENYQYLLPVNAQLIKREYDWHAPQKKDPVGIITTGSCQLLYLSYSNKYIDIEYSKIKHDLSLFFCYRGEEKLCYNELSGEGCYNEDDFVDIYDKNGCLIAELDLSIYSTDRSYYYNEQLTLLSRRNKRFGVIDSTGIIIPFRYHDISRRHGISLTRKLRQGIREQEEFIIAEVHYKQNDNVIKEYDVYNSEGKCIIHGLLYQQDKLILNPNDSTNIIVQSGNKFTAYTRDGKRIKTINNIEALGDFNNHGLAIAKSENGYVGLVNANLMLQTSFVYNKFSKSDISDHIIIGVCNRSHYIFIKDGEAHHLLYNHIKRGKHDFLLVSRDEGWRDDRRWGILNNEGLEIIGCSYLKEEISIVDADTIVIPTYNNNGKIAVDKYGNDKGLTEEDLEALLPIVERRNSKGQPVADLYTQFGAMCFGYQRVKNHDDKWGFIDSNNDEVTPFIYDFVWDMSEHGLAAVKTESGCGIIDKTGKYILLPGYSGADYNHSFITPEDIDRTFVVIKDGKYGLLFPGFKEALPPIYDKLDYNLHHVDYSSETGFIYANKDGKYGILMIKDETIVTLIECIYDSIEYFTNETSAEILNERYFIGKREIDGIVQGEIFNLGGKIVDRFNGDLTLKFAHRDTFAYSDSGSYYYNKITIKHLNCVNCYDRIYELRGRYLTVKSDGKYGVYDTSEGREIIPCKYDNWPSEFEKPEDIVPVHINGKFGFIDINDNLILEPKYEGASVFRDGLAAVSLNNKWGYVNLKGEQVIPYIYEYAGAFSSGLAIVKKGSRYGYIDRFNNVIIPFRYTDAGNFSRGLASVSTEDYHSKITPKGIEVEYKHISRYSSNDDDYARDSWYAMTDGMYGDYEGYDGDYDFMGY